MIFVFGSNEAGIHGAGAAKTAYQEHGAVRHVGFGPQGQAFAIPTKDWKIQRLPFLSIEHYVQRFIIYARFNPMFIFQVTALGTGLAGYSHEVMAPLFKYAPENCQFDELWKLHLPKKKFWGSF